MGRSSGGPHTYLRLQAHRWSVLDSPHARFLVSLLAVFPLAAIVAPPDVFAQLLATVLLVVLSYYLSYGGGYDALLDS